VCLFENGADYPNSAEGHRSCDTAEVHRLRVLATKGGEDPQESSPSTRAGLEIVNELE
jgi:hypothetical protein